MKRGVEELLSIARDLHLNSGKNCPIRSAESLLVLTDRLSWVEKRYVSNCMIYFVLRDVVQYLKHVLSEEKLERLVDLLSENEGFRIHLYSYRKKETYHAVRLSLSGELFYLKSFKSRKQAMELREVIMLLVHCIQRLRVLKPLSHSEQL